MRDTSKQLNELDDLIELYEQTINGQREMLLNDLEEDGFTEKLADTLTETLDDDIRKFGLSDINDLLVKTGCSDTALKEAYYYEKDKSVSFLEFAIDILLKIKEKWYLFKEAEDNLTTIKEERLDITRSYVETLKSPEYREARLNQVKFLREQAESETDELKKADLLRRLDQIEKSQNLTFLNERLHRYGAKEARSIKESFFDQRKGTYVMERYYERLRRLKINHAIHGAFFNLEEKFLPVTYEPFNNFFLYHVIRFVAHVDVNNRVDYLYMSSLLSALRDLVTGESTEEEKNMIIGIMKDFYTFFEGHELAEYFKANNSNYKLHPDRIEADKREADRRKETMMINIRKELGYLYDEESTYDEPEAYLTQLVNEKLNMIETLGSQGIDTSDLHTYEEVYNEFIKLQKSEEPDNGTETEAIESNDDGNTELSE